MHVIWPHMLKCPSDYMHTLEWQAQNQAIHGMVYAHENKNNT